MDRELEEDHNHMFMFCLESAIAKDTLVRVVDAYVERKNGQLSGLDLHQLA